MDTLNNGGGALTVKTYYGTIFSIRNYKDKSLIFITDTTQPLLSRRFLQIKKYHSKNIWFRKFYEVIDNDPNGWENWYLQTEEVFYTDNKNNMNKRLFEISQSIGSLNPNYTP